MPSPARPLRSTEACTASRVPFQRPALPRLEDVERYFGLSRAAQQFANGGPCHELLIERARLFVGDRIVVPVSSGGVGLVVALRALVGEPAEDRREVLLASFTFAAAAAAVVWCGLEPVFCDVDPDGWHLAPGELEAAVAARGGRVAAILAAGTFGTPVPEEQIAEWARIADGAGVPLVVDSAAGFGVPGAELADAEIFSLHATKPLAIGEGGLVAVRDSAVARWLRVLINHGLDESRIAVTAGLNGKLDEWHAATALAGLDRLSEVIGDRQARAETLRERLGGCGIRFQEGASRSPTQFVAALAPSPAAREEILLAAAAANVELRTYFSPPLHRTPAYSTCSRSGELPVTEDLAGRILSLPMANDLTPAEIERIVACVGGRSG